ncbi:MAG: hypothetical protein KGH79_04410 [Patescibacteria group bacterium]|nr:hypothetical protein [Patescibacteria group bacterium]
MRSFIIAALVPLALIVTGVAGVAHAQVTDCTGQQIGASCQPLASPTGTLGQCEQSSNILIGGMVCVPISASPTPNQTNPPAGSGNSNPPAGLGNPVTTPTGQGQQVTLINPLNIGNCSSNQGGCLGVFLQDILQFVVYIGGIIVILMLVYTGFKFVAARGNPGALEEAKKMLLWTIVGALILLGAQAIALGIQATIAAIGT